MNSYIFTSESVSEGHPDKLCDRISDSVLDFFLKDDPAARVACESVAMNDTLIVGGEITSSKSYTSDDIETLARHAVRDIGYTDGVFSDKNLHFINKINVQSPDIAQGVDARENKEEGAGDQGIMFGYACHETDVFMPAPIYYSHLLVRKLAELRKNGTLPNLRPDAKSQISMLYKNGKPTSIKSVVLSTQHADGLSQSDIIDMVKPVIIDCLPQELMNDDIDYHINPTGKFVIGGPVGDAGLTGRKIIVDTYGGSAPHGGGTFSGKDPTKVDRSAAYAARYLAKNIVAAELADKCTIQLSYAIGVSRPISIYIDTHGTGKTDWQNIVKSIEKSFDLTPRGIRTALGLNKPIYVPTSAYGHFGRTPTADGHFSWEKTDLIDALHNNLK
jgi:S-adenosylmethionine synthetase